MTLTEFTREYQNLILEMETRMNEPENDRLIIPDGVMLPEKYFSNQIRLAWMLKEPYDYENGTGGGWDYSELFKGEDLYEERFKGSIRNTWHPIIYITHSIFNNFPLWEEMDFIRDDHSMPNILREVAFINSQKLPAKGVTVTNMNDLIESLEKFGDLIKRQVELLDPNVFIFGNTFGIYTNLLDLDNSQLKKNGTCNYLIKNSKLYIDAYHPGQKNTVDGKDYVNDILSTVKKWKNGELLSND